MVHRSRQLSTIAERRVQGLNQLIGASRMVEVVLPAEAGWVGERRGLRAGLTDDVAEPVDPRAGGVADGPPDRPQVGRWADRELLGRHGADDLAQPAVVLGPHVVGGSNRRNAHDATIRGASGLRWLTGRFVQPYGCMDADDPRLRSRVRRACGRHPARHRPAGDRRERGHRRAGRPLPDELRGRAEARRDPRAGRPGHQAAHRPPKGRPHATSQGSAWRAACWTSTSSCGATESSA